LQECLFKVAEFLILFEKFWKGLHGCVPRGGGLDLLPCHGSVGAGRKRKRSL
jgi:hypothetical protein